MQIKITVIEDQKQAVTNEFLEVNTAIDYLFKLFPEQPPQPVEMDEVSEVPTTPVEEFDKETGNVIVQEETSQSTPDPEGIACTKGDETTNEIAEQDSTSVVGNSDSPLSTVNNI